MIHALMKNSNILKTGMIVPTLCGIAAITLIETPAFGAESGRVKPINAKPVNEKPVSAKPVNATQQGADPLRTKLVSAKPDSVKLASAKTTNAPSATSGGGFKKIVSLAPSNTELLYSLGSADHIVGVSTYCTFPKEAKTKPKVGTFVSINWERLATLKPDIVLLVQGQESLSFQLKKHQIQSLSLNNKSLADISKNLIELGKISGQADRGEALAATFSARIADLKNIVKHEPKRKVFFCVWPKPIVTVGGDSFLNDVVTACGGENIAQGIKSSYPKYSPEKLVAANPDLLVMPHESKTTDFKSTPPWSLMNAVKTNRIYHLPDREHDYLSRPTLQIHHGLYDLAKRLHPGKEVELNAWYAKCQKEFPAN